MSKSDNTATSLPYARRGIRTGMVRAVTFLLCAGLLVSSKQALGEAGLTGEWSGSYTCIQGLTSLDLSVEETGAGRVEALFHFSADPANPRVPEGCFAMSGNFDAHAGRLVLLPGEWLMQPFGFITVGLDGHLDAKSDVIAGRVTKMAGCKNFVLHRLNDVPVRAARCHLEKRGLSV